MEKSSSQCFSLKPRAGRRRLTVVLLIAALTLAGIMGWVGMSPGDVDIPQRLPVFADAPGLSYRAVTLGDDSTAAGVSNVQIVDVDGDGVNDVLVCDAVRNSVLYYRRVTDEHWEEHLIADGLPAPAHATVVDLDQDGDKDIIVSVMGSLNPSDELIGKVIWLENDHGTYHKHVLLEDVRRVVDVQAGDFDGDGDIDLVVAVFGYARGEVLWLENLGGGRFRDHQLLNRPGTIHVPVGDLDGDGDLDIAAVVSQDEEEVWVFENLGGGKFQPHRIWHTDNFDIGSAGLVMADLDQDGDLDLILPVGDNLEDGYQWAQPHHGCIWLENVGHMKFIPHRIANVGLTYAAAVSDLDGDGHRDVVLALMSHELDDPRQASLVWLRNDGRQNFTTYRLAARPHWLVTVACGDLNGDGKPDIVAGGIHLFRANPKTIQRVTVWLSQGTSP